MKITLSKRQWEFIGKQAQWLGDNGNEYRYYINLNERGEFYADVRNEDDDTIFEIKGFDVFEDGWMKDPKDINGLKEYLVHLGSLKESDRLTMGN